MKGTFSGAKYQVENINEILLTDETGQVFALYCEVTDPELDAVNLDSILDQISSIPNDPPKLLTEQVRCTTFLPKFSLFCKFLDIIIFHYISEPEGRPG